MTQIPTTREQVIDVSPHELHAWLREGAVTLVDVREPAEHADVRIAGAALHPLSTFDPAGLRVAFAGRRVVFHCKGGGRSAKAAALFGREGDAGPALAGHHVAGHHLAGGIDAWIAAGLPVLRPQAGPRLPIMRQVHIAAGGLVLAGTLAGALLSPWLLVVPGFVGCGLVFAGATGWCGMAELLAAMPWNRPRHSAPRPAPPPG